MGFAIGYALSRGTLLVSALLGVFVYREFNGADAKTWAVQIAALYLLLRRHSAGSHGEVSCLLRIHKVVGLSMDVGLVHSI